MSERNFSLATPFSLYNGAVVLHATESNITFGLTDDSDMALKERLTKAVQSFFRGSAVAGACDFVPISRERFEHIVSMQYGKSGDTSAVSPETDDTAGEVHAAVLLLDSLLERARELGATDIHIEENRVRFRINGVLQTMGELAAERSRELVRRIKMLAKLDVLEKRAGQDGQFVAAEHLFVRVSVVPVVSAQGDGFCESAVLRLLDPSRVPLDFAGLGFLPAQCAVLEDFARLEQGLVLLCGSTGAGKSTTAAALLSAIAASATKKIITLEEPPEYLLRGVTQVAMDARLDFDAALRCIFRQDPDVIFIGEIRDEKTARVAVQAAVTGHLVFATMHTSGFYETTVRLGQLGVDAKSVASVLRGIIVQQLSVADGTVSLNAAVLPLDSACAWALCSAEKSEDINIRIQEAVV